MSYANSISMERCKSDDVVSLSVPEVGSPTYAGAAEQH